MIYIGVDPGVNTGIASWNTKLKDFQILKTTNFWGCIDILNDFIKIKNSFGDIGFKVFIEDTTKSRVVFGRNSMGRSISVGMLIKETQLIIDFCENNDINIIKKIPTKNTLTKLNAKQFKQLTGWQGRTSQHSRDAGMMVYGLK